MNEHRAWSAPVLLVLLLVGGAIPAAGDGPCGPIDFVLLLDDTGSMDSAIGDIQTEIGDVISSLRSQSGGDLQVALVTFKDDVTVQVALTPDTDRLSTALGAVTASGGGGEAEASDEALAQVLSDLAPSFRPGSRRIAVVVTDAPPGGPDGIYSPGVDDVRAVTLAEDARSEGILLSSVFVLTRLAQSSSHLGDIRAIMERYAAITGGTFHEVGEDGDGTAAAVREVLKGCGTPSCGDRAGEKVLCTVDGSGDFTYSFTFVNLGDEPVRHLFLLDPPEGVSFVPRRLEFDPPVRPGFRRTVPEPVRIEGAEAGQEISFLLSAHDSLLEECCSVRVTLELPACDCGQVTLSDPPHCTLFGEPGSAQRLDRFVFQNLFREPVEHLLVTPVAPTDVHLTPEQFDLSGEPLQAGDQTELSVRIEGGLPGDRVCYQVSSHDAELDDCCSIERCVELPDCRFVVDDVHSIGDTEFELVEDGLLLSGFPPVSSGRSSGIVLETGGVAGLEAEWVPPRSETLAPGAFLRKTFLAPVDGGEPEPVAVLETVQGLDGVELHGRFPALGTEHQTIELFRGGFLVDRIENVPVEEPLRPIFNAGPATFETDVRYTFLGHVPITQSGGRECDPYEAPPGTPPCLFAGYTYKKLLPWGFPFTFALADEVRLIPEDGTGRVGPLGRVNIEAAGIESLLIEAVDLEHDCNRNARPDGEDLALGASLDLDRDGRPDECEADAGRRRVLSTGFDGTTGKLLPPGAEDAGWRVETLGVHARVVERPNRLWADPLPGSAWISVDGERGASVAGSPLLSFERCFCLADGSGPVELTASAFADDAATAFLNGMRIAGPGGRFAGAAPLEIGLSGKVGEGPLRAGENCLVIEVNDSGGFVTGLDLAGRVRAESGFCR